MKILKIEIYSPKSEKIREVSFNEIGLSVIYGNVEKPNKQNETSNSIGKTVLLKILNVVLGAKNSGKDTIKGLNDYLIKSVVKFKSIEYDVEITIGDSKSYYVNNEKMNLTKYKEKFNINRALFGKQINLDKRKGIISSLNKNANKEDFSAILKMIYLDGIQSIFAKIKKMQEEIDLINKYNNSYKDDTISVEKEKFNLEMKKKQIDKEIELLNQRINDLKISSDINEISIKRTCVDQLIKKKNEEYQINNIRISKYEETIKDSLTNSISLDEVKKIYENAMIEIPDLLIKELSQIETFYDNLFKDKNSIYNEQIVELKLKNEVLLNDIKEESKTLDKLSKVISENDTFKEAIKVYNLKTEEKIEIETKISEINGKLSQINNTKDIKSNIDKSYIELNNQFEIYKTQIESYREFMYELVKKIYGEERNPYLTISISDGGYKYKALPVKIDLSIDGDSGEGICAAKYLLFDYLIMNYNKDIEMLIEDSACFEGIDRRQVSNILAEGISISKKTNKQYIVTLNKYLIDNYELIKDFVVVSLSEKDTLLNTKF